jgi:integrator complex subunit 4
MQMNINNLTKGILDSGDISVEGNFFLSSSSFGSFIHGSEDEFSTVRIAAVESMSKIGLKSKDFASTSLIFLLDMFNDEDSRVRLIAVNCISLLSNRWKLSIPKETLTAVALVLRDNEFRVKILAHRMLRCITFLEIETFRLLINILSSELRASVSQESLQMEILASFAFIAKNHFKFVEQLVPIILDIDPMYLVKEFPMNDMVHIAHLIMIFNACSINHEISKILPVYVISRYPLIFSKYGAIVPKVKKICQFIFSSTVF